MIKVRSINGINGFQVFASHIDNTAGRAIFLAGYPGGGRSEDGVVELLVEAVGEMGDRSILQITLIDVLANSDGIDITDYEIINGRATIEVEMPF